MSKGIKMNKKTLAALKASIQSTMTPDEALEILRGLRLRCECAGQRVVQDAAGIAVDAIAECEGLRARVADLETLCDEGADAYNHAVEGERDKMRARMKPGRWWRVLTDKLAARLRELSSSSGWLFVAADAEQVCQAAANELDRLDSALREHMQLTRDAIEQCDKLRARIAELERQPIRWRPISEAPKDCEVLLWSSFYKLAFLGEWSATGAWVDAHGEKIKEVTKFAEVAWPEGESC